MNCKQISAVILAAGQSARLGKPKQLIPWQETTLLNFTISVIRQSGIEDIVLVLGASAEEIKKTLNNQQLRIVNNLSWATGKASSIRAGLNAICSEATGVLIFLCDQPYLSTDLICSILQAGDSSEADIIAPIVGDQLSNPVLFKINIFPAFYTLQGEEGGKNLFSKYTMQRVPWMDERILLDIDTQEDVEKLT
ncbi:MAG: NTP transferase domain-containing protein [Anaerolineaceae bacterium]